ncbi:hypothetical protein HK405_000249, partial [Cladochytrium tenue]
MAPRVPGAVLAARVGGSLRHGTTAAPLLFPTSTAAAYGYALSAAGRRHYAAPSFTPEEAQLALSRARRTVTGQLAPTSQIYYYEVFRRVAASPALFVFQNNNSTS